MPLDRKFYAETAIPHIFCLVNQSDLMVDTTKVKRIRDKQGRPLSDTTYYLTIKFDQMNLELALNPRQATLFGDLILQSLAHANEGKPTEERLEFNDYDLDDDDEEPADLNVAPVDKYHDPVWGERTDTGYDEGYDHLGDPESED